MRVHTWVCTNNEYALIRKYACPQQMYVSTDVDVDLLILFLMHRCGF